MSARLGGGVAIVDWYAVWSISWSTSPQFVVISTGMSLLRYFKASSGTAKLPDPCGPQSTTIPLSSTESANAEVKRVIETEEC